MIEKYEIEYPVQCKVDSVGDAYLADRNGTLSSWFYRQDRGGRTTTKAIAIADALNRVPQLEAENNRLRKRCEELEAELERERGATRAMPPQSEIDKFLVGMGLSPAKEVRVGFDMTLSETLRRDLFAAAALARYPANLRETRQCSAEACYQMADAMLAEARKGGV